MNRIDALEVRLTNDIKVISKPLLKLMLTKDANPWHKSNREELLSPERKSPILDPTRLLGSPPKALIDSTYENEFIDETQEDEEEEKNDEYTWFHLFLFIG